MAYNHFIDYQGGPVSKESVDAFMAIALVGSAVVGVLGFIFWLIYHAYMELFRDYPYDLSPTMVLFCLVVVGVILFAHHWYFSLPDKILR
jgi:preprotein translocase subunit Sss1